MEFALGNGEYYLRDRDYDEHWVLGSWINYILPYCRENNCDVSVREMFQALIKDNTLPQQEKIDSLLYHLYVLCYVIEDKRFDNKDLIKDFENDIIFEVENLKNNIIFTSDFNRLNELRNTLASIQSKGGLSNYRFE